MRLLPHYRPVSFMSASTRSSIVGAVRRRRRPGRGCARSSRSSGDPARMTVHPDTPPAKGVRRRISSTVLLHFLLLFHALGLLASVTAAALAPVAAVVARGDRAY